MVEALLQEFANTRNDERSGERPIAEHSLLGMAAEACWVIDVAANRIEYVNPAFETLWGVVNGADPALIVERLCAEDQRLHREDLLGPREDLTFAVCLVDAAGNRARHVQVRVSPSFEGGQLVRVQAVATDITDLHEAARELETKSEWVESLLGYSTDSIAILDEHGIRRFQSRSIERLFGQRPGDVLGLPLDCNTHPEDKPRLAAFLADVAATPDAPLRGEWRERRTDGNYSYVECVATNLLSNVNVRGIVTHMRDITERRFMDPQTGLPNRALFTHHVEISLGAGDQIAVVAIGIDRYGSLQETLPERGRDALINEIARRLDGCVRVEDVVARLGPSTFALLTHVPSVGEAVIVASRIRGILTEPFTIEGASFVLSASTGVAIGPEGVENAEAMIRSAETALNRAKRRGNSSLEVFEHAMRDETRHRLLLEVDLHRALLAEEFIPYYQPIISMRTGELSGFEVLVRWRKSTGEIVSPALFTPLAEEIGLISQIDLSMLKQACKQLRQWRSLYENAHHLSVHANISATNFEDPEFGKRIQQVLEETELPADAIHLEVTETGIIANPTHAAETMHALKKLGVRFSLDDFGTGYSSLSYLHRLPFDTLKIDRSFVSGIGSRDDKPDLVRVILLLAQSLRLGVIAEGVETEAQAAFLRALDCEHAQGFLFSKPKPAIEVEAMIRDKTVF